jgi:hypothetical protein
MCCVRVHQQLLRAWTSGALPLVAQAMKLTCHRVWHRVVWRPFLISLGHDR